jgi:hypothetical protein
MDSAAPRDRVMLWMRASWVLHSSRKFGRALLTVCENSSQFRTSTSRQQTCESSLRQHRYQPLSRKHRPRSDGPTSGWIGASQSGPRCVTPSMVSRTSTSTNEVLSANMLSGRNSPKRCYKHQITAIYSCTRTSFHLGQSHLIWFRSGLAFLLCLFCCVLARKKAVCCCVNGSISGLDFLPFVLGTSYFLRSWGVFFRRVCLCGEFLLQRLLG